MPSTPIRIGFIGCGSVLRHYMAVVDRLRERGLAVAAAACDARESRGPEVREAFGIQSFSTDYHDVALSDDVDLVVVQTPDLFHGPITRLALNAGKHVLVEKPLTMLLDETGQKIDLDRTLNDAAELIELSQRGSSYLACAPFVVLSPTHQAMRRRLKAGEIGKAASARARYGNRMPNQSWVYRPGGGPLFNIGTYNLTSLTGLLGPVRRVTAFTGVAFPEARAGEQTVRFEAEEDNAQIILDFGEGVLGALTTGWTMRGYRSPAIELFGDQGTLHLLGEDWAPKGYEIWRTGDAEWETVLEPEPAWSWSDGLRHFVECIHAGRRPSAMLAHAYHVLEILLKAKASARDGQTRRLDSTFSPDELLA